MERKANNGLAESQFYWHLSGVGRQALDMISEFARQGHRVRFTCQACGHVVDANAIELMASLHRRGLSLATEAVERRAKCSKCGKRRAKVSAAMTK